MYIFNFNGRDNCATSVTCFCCAGDVTHKRHVVTTVLQAESGQAGARLPGHGRRQWRVQADLAQRLPRQIRRLLLLPHGLVSGSFNVEIDIHVFVLPARHIV